VDVVSALPRTLVGIDFLVESFQSLADRGMEAELFITWTAGDKKGQSDIKRILAVCSTSRVTRHEPETGVVYVWVEFKCVVEDTSDDAYNVNHVYVRLSTAPYTIAFFAPNTGVSKSATAPLRLDFFFRIPIRFEDAWG
jgi:hypothetical protein